MKKVIAAAAITLTAACSTSVPGVATVRSSTPQRISVVLTVTQDDCCASKATIGYVDPETELAESVQTYYAWQKRLGPFSSLDGDVWLSVDNTTGKQAAHCSVAVTGHPVNTATIPAGETGACSVSV